MPAVVDQKLTESLIALLEQGTTPWRHEWDAVGGGHHVNLISGRRYRGSNPVLLTLGKPMGVSSGATSASSPHDR